MAKTVKIRTLVAVAGRHFSLAAGDEWEVDEEVAKARIAAGLAEAIEPEPRSSVRRGGKQAEAAVDEAPEKRS